MSELGLGRADAAALATRLLAGSRDRGGVDLGVTWGLELCVFGAAEGVLTDDEVVRSWRALGRGRRESSREEVTASVRRRGLGAGSGSSSAASSSSDGEELPLTVTLPLILAALTEPVFAVAGRSAKAVRRPMKLFAVGPDAGSAGGSPIVGFVVEQPETGPPGDLPNVRRLGALGWFFGYSLVTPERAADLLARWLVGPPADPVKPEPRTLAVLRPGRDRKPRVLISALGDGASAQAEASAGGRGEVSGRLDEAGLRALVGDVLGLDLAGSVGL